MSMGRFLVGPYFDKHCSFLDGAKRDIDFYYYELRHKINGRNFNLPSISMNYKLPALQEGHNSNDMHKSLEISNICANYSPCTEMSNIWTA